MGWVIFKFKRFSDDDRSVIVDTDSVLHVANSCSGQNSVIWDKLYINTEVFLVKNRNLN